MVKRTHKPMTQRERQCRKVARGKAKRKWLDSFWLRMRQGGALTAVVLVLGAGWSEYHHARISTAYHNTVNAVYAATADAGFAVHGLYLDGRRRTGLKDVQTALAIEENEPILALNLTEVRERLESLGTVKHAVVERSLPDALHVQLIERDPVAVWQQGGKLTLIDEEGTSMEDLSPSDYSGLPVIIGDDAPAHVGDVLRMLEEEPQMRSLIVAAVRVGERRWNMRMRGNVEIKLPEEGAAQAWHQLAELHRNHGLLDRAIRTVDLRQRDRFTLQLAPSDIPSLPTTIAHET